MTADSLYFNILHPHKINSLNININQQYSENLPIFAHRSLLITNINCIPRNMRLISFLITAFSVKCKQWYQHRQHRWLLKDTHMKYIFLEWMKSSYVHVLCCVYYRSAWFTDIRFARVQLHSGCTWENVPLMGERPNQRVSLNFNSNGISGKTGPY